MNLMQQFMNIFKNVSNPQQILSKFLETSPIASNPMVINLLKMAKNGNNQGVEQFARNMFKEQGRDFDNEFQAFMSSFNK